MFEGQCHLSAYEINQIAKVVKVSVCVCLRVCRCERCTRVLEVCVYMCDLFHCILYLRIIRITCDFKES